MLHMIDKIREWVVEGRLHDIPVCCGIRFGLGHVLRPPQNLWSGLIRIHHISPRRAYALHFGEGYVPCEYHLVRWLLTGRKPTIKQDEDTP